MRRATWERTGATGAVLGGLLWAGFPLWWLALSPATREALGNPYVAAGPGLFVPLLGLTMGAVGLRQSRRAAESRVGRVGTALTLLGLVALTLGTLAEFWVLGAVGVGPSDPRWTVGRGLALGGLAALVPGTLLLGRAVERRTTTAGQGVALLLSWPLSGLLVVALFLAETPVWTHLLALTAPFGIAWALVGTWLWRTAGRYD